MPPIVGAIAGALAGLGTLGTALVTLAASVALSALSAALSKKDTAESGSEFTIKFGGDRPRTAILGKSVEAGHMLDCFTYGSDNKKMMLLLGIGDGWHGAITKTWIGGTEVAWDGALGTTWRSSGSFFDGGAKLRIKYYDGQFDQAADTDLIAASGGRWTSNDRIRGVAYVLIDMEYNEKLELTGIPDLLFEVEGLRLYDPRKDSTVEGGSGSHRWGTPSTYETTTNPKIIEYNVRRGIYINDQLIFGLGLPSGDLLLDTYVAAANDCDDDIPLAAGGTEPRYRIGTRINAQQPAADILAEIRAATAGFVIDRAGEFAVLAGVTQSIAGTFADEDAIVGQPISFSRFRPRPEIATAVHGKFSDPAQQWQSVDFPPREDEDDDEAMGERLTRTNDYSMVFSVSQAQRLAEIDRRLSMLQANGSLTLPAKFIVMQPGDWWTYESGRWGERTVQITDVTINTNLTVTISWREIDAYAYNWSTAGEIEYAPNPIAPGRGSLITSVPGFAVEPGTALGAGGVRKPIIKASWTPIVDPTVDSVLIEYRKVDDDEVLTFLAADPGLGLANISAGVQHMTGYEARARIITTPQRGWLWSSWLPVTVTDEVTGPSIGVVDGAIDPGSLADFLADDLFVNAPQRLRDLEYEFRTHAHEAGEFSDWIRERVELSKEDSNAYYTASSTAIQSIAVRTTVVEGKIVTQAEFITSLESAVEALDGSVAAQSTAISGLTTRVGETETGLTAASNYIVSLGSTADQTAGTGAWAGSTAMGGMNTRVTTAEGTITTQAAYLTSLQSTVDQAASTGAWGGATALGGLTTRVDETEDNITATAESVNELSVIVSGPGPGPGGLEASVTEIASVTADLQSGSATAFYGFRVNSGTNVAEFMGYADGTASILKMKASEIQLWSDDEAVGSAPFTVSNVAGVPRVTFGSDVYFQAALYIDDGDITTNLLEANAVTAKAFYAESDRHAYLGTGSTATLASMSLTTSGKPLELEFNVSGYDYDVSAGQVGALEIVVDSTVVKTIILVSARGYGYGSGEDVEKNVVTINSCIKYLTDSLTAGAHTFYLKGINQGADFSTGLYVSGKVMEYKA